MKMPYRVCYCEKREKGESLIFVIEKRLIIHGLGYIYIYVSGTQNTIRKEKEK